MKVVMEVPLKLDPGRGQYNSSRRMNEADERHTPRQSTYPAASLRLGIAWITHTKGGPPASSDPGRLGEINDMGPCLGLVVR